LTKNDLFFFKKLQGLGSPVSMNRNSPHVRVGKKGRRRGDPAQVNGTFNIRVIPAAPGAKPE